jgi:RNA polymerase sigma factor (sigma-70 family)
MDDKRSRFEAQVLPHLDAAHRFARWLCRSPGDADDIVQEAFLRAFRAFDSLRGTEVKAWLLAIVRNCHATAMQQQQRRATVPLPDESELRERAAGLPAAPDPEAHSMAQQTRSGLVALLARLPSEQREVLLLREVEELSYREIATLMELPIGTVMSRLARARAALKTLGLQEAQGEPRAVR